MKFLLRAVISLIFILASTGLKAQPENCFTDTSFYQKK